MYTITHDIYKNDICIRIFCLLLLLILNFYSKNKCQPMRSKVDISYCYFFFFKLKHCFYKNLNEKKRKELVTIMHSIYLHI